MAVASDNVFPKLILLEGSTPASPSAGNQKLFFDTADHKAKRVNSSGLVTSLEDLVSTKAANYSIVASDNRTLFIANAASLVFTLPAPATAGAGFRVTIANNNQTTTGIKTNTAGVTINGVDCSSTAYTAGLTSAYGAVTLETDATAWFVVAANGTSGGGSSTLAGLTDVSLASLANFDQFQFQTADSKWHNVTGGMVRIAPIQTLAAIAASITFSSIPSGYSALRLVIQQKSDTGGVDDFTRLRFNGDTGANFDSQFQSAGGSAQGAGAEMGATSMRCGITDGFTSTCTVIDIPNYAGTTLEKNLVSTGTQKNGNGSGNLVSIVFAGHWRSTAAITSITLFPNVDNFAIGSTFGLYGLV